MPPKGVVLKIMVIIFLLLKLNYSCLDASFTGCMYTSCIAFDPSTFLSRRIFLVIVFNGLDLRFTHKILKGETARQAEHHGMHGAERKALDGRTLATVHGHEAGWWSATHRTWSIQVRVAINDASFSHDCFCLCACQSRTEKSGKIQNKKVRRQFWLSERGSCSTRSSAREDQQANAKASQWRIIWLDSFKKRNHSATIVTRHKNNTLTLWRMKMKRIILQQILIYPRKSGGAIVNIAREKPTDTNISSTTLTRRRKRSTWTRKTTPPTSLKQQ